MSDIAQNDVTTKIIQRFVIVSFEQFETDYSSELKKTDVFKEKKLIDRLRAQYLKNKKCEKLFSIKYYGFLNSSQGKEIKFFKSNIYEDYFLFPFDKNNNLLTRSDDSDCFTDELDWAYFYVRIFKKEFLLIDSSKISLDELLNFDKEKNEHSNFVKTIFYTNDGLNFNESDLKQLHINDRDKYQDLHNIIIFSGQKILISTNNTYDRFLERVANRTAIIYLLAMAYINKMEEFVEVSRDEIRDITHSYEELLRFNLRYFYKLPLKLNRVNQLAAIWQLIYKIYHIGDLNKELEEKLANMTNYSLSRKRAKRSMIITIVASLAGALISGLLTYWFNFISQ